MKKKNILRAAALLLCLLLVLPGCLALAEGQPSLTLDQTELTLVKGKQKRLRVVLENTENPAKARITWATSDPAVASVDKGGTVKAVEGGTAVITCSAALKDGTVLTASVPVSVKVPAKSLKILTKANTAVHVGQALPLEWIILPENTSDQTVTWTSAKEDVVRMDGHGTATAVSAGKVSITGTTANGISARVILYVPTLSPSADTFRMTAADSVYHFGYYGDNFRKNVQVTVQGKGFSYTLIRNDPDIGVSLTAQAPGEATLTVTDKKDGNARFSVRITAGHDAFPPGKRLVITRAVYNRSKGTLTVDWINTGDKAVAGAELRVNPLDADGRPLAVGGGNTEDIPLEKRVFRVSTVTEPGKKGSGVFVIGRDYPAAAAAEAAFSRFIFGDGSEQELPDNRLCWYATAQKAYKAGPESIEPYVAPSYITTALAEEAHSGFEALPVSGEVAEAYGFARGGMLVVSVEEGSPADAAGLKPGDLVFEAGGRTYAEEPNLLTLAAADLAAGTPAALKIERDHTVYEVSLKPAD